MKFRLTKKIVQLLSACVLSAVLMCGCFGKKDEVVETTATEPASVETDRNTTLQRGVLLVGMYVEDNVFCTNLEDGTVEGFDVDLANAIGEYTYLEVKFVNMSRKGGYSDLDNGLYDCVISGVIKDDAVDKVYDFSAPYLSIDGNEYVIVTKTGNNRLLNVLNKSIGLLRENGRLDEIYTKWFVTEEESSEEASE